MTGDPTLWILARSTGVVAYGLLTATVLAGLVTKARPARAVSPAASLDMHRFLSLLALLAVGMHGLFLALDASVPIPVAALVLPGVSPYRPLWTGAGVVAAELMLLIHLSFRFRRAIGLRTWRRLHWLTYAVFAGATAHGLMAGTDSARPWASAMYTGASGAVVALTGWRALAPRRAARRAGTAAPQPEPAAAAPSRRAPAPAAAISPRSAERSPGRFTASAPMTPLERSRYRARNPPGRSSITGSGFAGAWPIIWSRQPNWSDQKYGGGAGEGG